MLAEQIKLQELITAEMGPDTFQEVGEFQFLGLGQRFLDAIVRSLGSFNIKLLTKEQFLKVVELAFDTMIAPKLPPFIAPFMKSLVLKAAESLYDKLTGV